MVGLPQGGSLTELLNSDDVKFGGSGIGNAAPIEVVDEPFESQPCSAQLTLPPLSAVYFEYKMSENTKPSDKAVQRKKKAATKE